MMPSADANPYASPATDAADAAEPAARLPLEPLLFGLLPAIIATAATHAGMLLPVAGLEYAAFGYWDFPPGPLELMAPLVLAMIVWTLLGTPLVLLGWWTRRLTISSVLTTGAIIAFLMWAVVATLAIDLLAGPDPAEMFDAVYVAGMMAVAAGVPTFAGFAAYAWWLNRTRRRLDVSPSRREP